MTIFGSLAHLKRTEILRSRLFYGILLIYILALVEGALRKWFFPSLEQPLFFMRDPIVIATYIYAWRAGAFTNTLAHNWFIFAILLSAVAAYVFADRGLPVISWALALRNYWLYLPLAFVAAKAFQEKEFRVFAKLNIVISAPYLFLVVAQYRAGQEGWLNAGALAPETVAVVGGHFARPYGLFTFSSQNVNFTLFLVALCLGFAFLDKKSQVDKILMWFSVFTVGSLVLLTGSRAVLFYVCFMVLVVFLGGVVAGHRSLVRNIAMITLATGVSTVLFIYMYDDMYLAMTDRFADASRIEGSVWNRLAYTYDVLTPFYDAPWAGYGLGTGTPALSRLLGVAMMRYGEGELPRVMNELGPLMGSGFLFARLSTTALIISISIRGAKRGDTFLLPLAGYAAPQIATGEITASTLNAFLPWLATGIILAYRRQTSIGTFRHKSYDAIATKADCKVGDHVRPHEAS